MKESKSWIWSLVQVGRDCFARYNIMRGLIPKTNGGVCQYCGFNRGRFHYYVWADDKNHPESIYGDFCSIECMRSYHGK